MDLDRRSRFMNQSRQKNEDYVDVGVDLHSLDILCKMVLSSNRSIRRSHLMNIIKFLDIINPGKYINDPEKTAKIQFIRKGVEARLGFNLDDPYMIMQHINGGIISDDIIDINQYKELSNADVGFMNTMVSETLQYATIYQSVDRMMDICTRFKTQDYGTKADIVEEFKNQINETQNEFRRNRNEDHTDMMFSLKKEIFEDCVTETYNRAANPRKKLLTGMQGMNEMLGGGFESGRVYIYFGLPGEGKSSLALNLLYQIKKYNREYECKDKTKRPCVVLLTMENTVEESIERLFGLATDRDRITDFDLETVIDMLKTEGELTLTDTNPIDIIIKYKPTNSVDTGYMYTLTDDLEDQGYEVIAFFQDYIGRIKSTQHLADSRLEYGAVTDDFKTYAQFKDIPVISLSQLNRDASRKIDEGRHASKNDLVRALGRSNISESMLVLNNIDGGFMITPEFTNTGDKYLGVQRVKIRYRASDIDTIYMPFSNSGSIRLLEDVGKEEVFKTTLRVLPAGVPTTVVSVSQSMRNEIPYMDEIKQVDANSIFNTEVLNASTVKANNDIDEEDQEDLKENNSIDTLDAAFLHYMATGRIAYDPMVFFDRDLKKPRNIVDPMIFEPFSIYK